jgi:hypothetical protein
MVISIACGIKGQSDDVRWMGTSQSFKYMRVV